jgi:peptidoglycan/LPS O-acetylase OafA/YrhL
MEMQPGASAGAVRLPKLLCIDLLRGLAALTVLLHHSNTYFWGTSELHHSSWAYRICHATLGHGDLGVELFFVISGFCIHLPYARLRRIDALPFLVRRFFRIYPVYIVTVLLCFGLLALSSGLKPDPRHYLINLLGHAVFWLYTLGQRGPVSTVLWTLALEAQFYLMYLVLFPLLRRVGFGRATAFFLVAELAYSVAFSTLRWTTSGPLYTFAPSVFPLTRFAEWMLGAWLADRFVNHQAVHWAAWRPAWLILAAAGLLLAAIWGLSVPVLVPHITPLVSIAFVALLAGMIRREGEFVRRLGPTELGVLSRWLADRSYSLYLIHFTVIAATGLAVARLFHIPSRDAIRGTPWWLVVTLCGVVMAFIATDLLYRLVEAPSHRLARTLSRRMRPPSPAPQLVPAAT